jgi:hypothetical protein
MSRSLAVFALVTGLALAGCAGTTRTLQPSQPSSGTPSGGASTTSKGKPQATTTESNPPGDIPDNQVYVRFSAPAAGVSIKVPEGWGRTTSARTTVFTDKLNRIEITPGHAASAPTVMSVRGELAKLASSVPKFQPGKVTADRRAGQPVVVVTYQGDSPTDPVTGKVVRDAFELYIYVHAGRRLDLTLSGPTNADNVDPWRIVSDSVRWQ